MTSVSHPRSTHYPQGHHRGGRQPPEGASMASVRLRDASAVGSEPRTRDAESVRRCR
jgi:hypothetical protein